ncbi:DNA-binding protein, excisionase family (plasmid) [Corynebacterium mustelae]|uniref:DNA-binding protein, excisionase family n=1 Tax=Corynebacterium mustelae TaxID=571915 RepID=A0A0G3H6C9_9CORY|nr:helix-turn-helix domain-containing protein [Corynebacterium mustelae]AKK07408.1 DNA-binding protein, excisionase family [Corynebacterium mustelae]
MKGYSTREVADLLEVPVRTIQGWVSAGRIPGAFRTPGGRWRIPAAWVGGGVGEC